MSQGPHAGSFFVGRQAPCSVSDRGQVEMGWAPLFVCVLTYCHDWLWQCILVKFLHTTTIGHGHAREVHVNTQD